MTMKPPLVAQGDPESLLCRWCGGMRARHNGALLCPHCDSPQIAGEVHAATWSEASASAPCDVGDKVRVIRGPHKGEVGMLLERDTEAAVGTVIITGVSYAISLRDLRRVT